MAKFLPPEANGVTYAIQNNAQSTFTAEASGFLQEIATKMAVETVDDVGRIPSLMSRAYNFYIDLFPEQFAGGGAEVRTGRVQARLRAVRIMRGIVTLLALRDVLGLNVELREFNPVGFQTVPSTNRYRPVFADAYGDSPEFGKPGDVDMHQGAPTSPWRNLRYLVLQTPVGRDESGNEQFKTEPLCGLSPFTLFFPAGRPMQHCNNVFWYNNTTGEWLDPTIDWTSHRDENSPTVEVNYEVIKSLRGCMIKWLELVLQGEPQLAWMPFGLPNNRATKVQEELKRWLAQLRNLDSIQAPQGFRIEAAAIGLNVKNSEGKPVQVPLLEIKAAWGTEGKGSLPGLISELPRVKGRILLSEKLLKDANIRICGRLMGNEMLSASLQSLPAEGETFVLHRGSKTYIIPEPYVIIDKLFLDGVHLIADGPISDNFSAMVTNSSNQEEGWLFPFKPELLRYVDIEKLRKRVGGDVINCNRSGGSRNNSIVVTVNVGGISFTRQYDPSDAKQANRDMAANALDVRIWPNFRFSLTPKLPNVDADRVHYFRVRQKSSWMLRAQILAVPMNETVNTIPSAVEIFKTKTWDPGWPDELDANAFRLARCYAFPAKAPQRVSDGTFAEGEWEPIGLVLEGRGFCLFNLEKPTATPQGQATPFRIGIDFGTSNTCIATAVISPGSDPNIKEIHFEVQTTSLHRYATYDDVSDQQMQGLTTEGAASVLDFPYKYGIEKFMTERVYFPTQLVTRLPEGAKPTDNQFLMSNGLIFPRNMLDNLEIVSILRNFPPNPEIDRRPIRLVPDPKWKNRMYRKAFLWHLYKLIVYHVARQGAEIKAAVFSFPRAFTKSVVDNYKNELHTIFRDYGQITAIEIMTESDAVQNWMAVTAPTAHPLVVDVGGGTTDLLGIFQQRKFQASYEFAAGFVNRYFIASLPFQKALRHAIKSVVPLQPAGTPEGDQQRNRRNLVDRIFDSKKGLDSAYDEQAFFRLLSMIEDKHYPAVVDILQGLPSGNQHDTDRMAICGFFHTLALLYTGIVYQAGQLMREHEIACINVETTFIGNGSRFFRFLKHADVGFSKIISGMFYAGYGRKPEMSISFEPEGKTLVAKGLLAPVQGDRAEVAEDTESHKYLLELAGNPNPKPPMTADFPDLKAFLEALNSQLPGGQMDGSTVIPYCGKNLAVEMQGLHNSIITAVFKQELEKARELKRAWNESEELAKTNQGAALPLRESALATEPVFIIRLKCLLDEIRERYAHRQ